MTEREMERFCVAFAWAYGTALERKYSGEPTDGLTPQQLWDQAEEDDREFMRSVVREAFAIFGDGEQARMEGGND